MKRTVCYFCLALICVMFSVQVIFEVLEGDYTMAPYLIYSVYGMIVNFRLLVICALEESGKEEAK